MDENQVRDTKSCKKTPDILNLPNVTSTLMIPTSSSDIDSGSINLINFLSYMTKTTLESYDPRYSDITLDQWPQLCQKCNRNISLIEGIKTPEKVCPRTKIEFSYSRLATKDDLSFIWYRFFVAVADWANNIPQFKILPDADQAQLLRLNFTTLFVIVFVNFWTKPEITLSRVSIGNGSYVNKEQPGM